MTLEKIEWDRDYHCITNRKTINSLDEVEDSWSGYNYSYMTNDGKFLSSTEAREFLKSND